MMTSPSVSSSLVTDTANLPLKGAALRCDARAGVARAVLEQRFANESRVPLRVTYTLPLPADAAVSGFRFRIGERTIEGTVDLKKRARERFEEALASGQTAALLEQDRTSLFTQEIGNVPPGVEVVCEIEIDQKLRFLDEGSWEWRFPLAAAPRYLGGVGRVPDAAHVSFDVAESLPARASLTMRVRDDVVSGRSPESSSHPLSVVLEGGAFHVELGSGNAVALDRDVVVRWPVAIDRAAAEVDVCGPRDARLKDAHALFTLVPPRRDAIRAVSPRDLTLLLDTSGSMSGAPIEQLKRVSLALIDSLAAGDRFEIIEFSNSPRRFDPNVVDATADTKRDASRFIRDLRASGGTEMREGILAALRPRHARADAVTQVVLVTDGLIGFEQEIVREILALLPRDARLHTVGVGSSINRSLTGPAARAGRGIEAIIGLGEDPERAVARLLARSVAPVVTEIEASGSALLELAPAKVPDLFAGAPVLLSARVRPEGGEIVLRGKTARGPWEERVRIAPSYGGEGSDAVATLFARESVEDAEMRIAAGSNAGALDALIESLGVSYRIATRLTSWVAIDSKQSVDPRDPSRRVDVPQALPHGMSVEGLGLRAQAPIQSMAYAARSVAAPRPSLARPSPAPPPPAAPAMGGTGAPPPPEEKAEAFDDELEADASLSRARVAEPVQKPAPQGEAKKDKGGFFERVRGAFTGRATTVIVWIGRIAFARNAEVAIEIVATDRQLAWKVLPEAVVLMKDGAQHRLTIDASRTTRDGTYEPGAVIRFVLQVPAGFDASQIAHVTIGDVHVELG